MSSGLQTSRLNAALMTWKLQKLPWNKSLSPSATELRLLITNLTVSFCKWLNYNANWILSLAERLLIQWGRGHWENMESWKLEWRQREWRQIPIKLAPPNPSVCQVFFAGTSSPSTPAHGGSAVMASPEAVLCDALLSLLRNHHHPSVLLDLYLGLHLSRPQKGEEQSVSHEVTTFWKSCMILPFFMDRNLKNMCGNES